MRRTEFSRALSKVRVSVEWGFGATANFAQQGAVVRHRMLWKSGAGLGKTILVEGFLYNCVVCVRRGNVIYDEFVVPTPTLSEYLE